MEYIEKFESGTVPMLTIHIKFRHKKVIILTTTVFVYSTEVISTVVLNAPPPPSQKITKVKKNQGTHLGYAEPKHTQIIRLVGQE